MVVAAGRPARPRRRITKRHGEEKTAGRDGGGKAEREPAAQKCRRDGGGVPGKRADGRAAGAAVSRTAAGKAGPREPDAAAAAIPGARVSRRGQAGGPDGSDY